MELTLPTLLHQVPHLSVRVSTIFSAGISQTRSQSCRAQRPGQNHHNTHAWGQNSYDPDGFSSHPSKPAGSSHKLSSCIRDTGTRTVFEPSGNCRKHGFQASSARKHHVGIKYSAGQLTRLLLLVSTCYFVPSALPLLLLAVDAPDTVPVVPVVPVVPLVHVEPFALLDHAVYALLRPLLLELRELVW